MSILVLTTFVSYILQVVSGLSSGHIGHIINSYGDFEQGVTNALMSDRQSV